MVCSAHCAEDSRRNWQEKKDKDIRPGAPILEQEDAPEMEDDTTLLD